jgi:hypothetical protein
VVKVLTNWHYPTAQGETQAFVQAYQGGLASDDSDDDMEPDQSQPIPEGEQAKDDDEAEDAPTIRNSKPMAIREIEDQVRRLARQTREREEALEVSRKQTITPEFTC